MSFNGLRRLGRNEARNRPTTSSKSLGTAFRDLVRHQVDILFANEAELLSLYETADFAAALAAVRQEVAIAAVTRSAKGSVIVAGGDMMGR